MPPARQIGLKKPTNIHHKISTPPSDVSVIILSSDDDNSNRSGENRGRHSPPPREISSANSTTRTKSKQRRVEEKVEPSSERTTPASVRSFRAPSTRSSRLRSTRETSDNTSLPARPALRTRPQRAKPQVIRTSSEASSAEDSSHRRVTAKRKRTQSEAARKKSKSDEPEVGSKSGDPVCIFCSQIFRADTEDNKEADKLMYHRMETESYDDGIHGKQTISAHYLCMFTASNLTQTGEKQSILNNVPGFIWGFSFKDLLKEKSRAARLKCKFCLKFGAAVGCSVSSCNMTYHYPCGLKNGCFFRFINPFESFCKKHIPADVLKRPKEKDIKEKSCAVCLDDPPLKDAINSLVTPCCMKVMHRECVARAALKSGKHYLKCPGCMEGDEFRKYCTQVGVHVPNQEAAWMADEDAEHAAEETANLPPLVCAPKDLPGECKCPNGSEYDEDVDGHDWNMDKCGLCGRFFHRACMHQFGDQLHCTWCYESEIRMQAEASTSSSSNQSRSSPEIPEIPQRRTGQHQPAARKQKRR